jgi:predicted Zn-dependent protease
MSPGEAANRLFNRVMVASESGNTEEALKFAPMALEAYDNLGTLDNDARYHVALLHLTMGDIKNARVQIDKLRQAVPNHLLAIMLEHQIAERSGKKDSATRAYKAFLAAYDTEIAAGRVEYQEHQSSIERFRKAAQASVAGKK